LRKYPNLLYEAYKVRIMQTTIELAGFIMKGEEEGQKVAVLDINKSFDICFDAISKME
jgi:hypothetical protein